MKSHSTLQGERKELLREIRMSDGALRSHFERELRAVDRRLQEMVKVGRPKPMRTRNGDAFHSGKFEELQ